MSDSCEVPRDCPFFLFFPATGFTPVVQRLLRYFSGIERHLSEELPQPNVAITLRVMSLVLTRGH